MAVRHRIVIADHGEQHRQREVRVVYRALLADDSRLRIGLAAGADVGHHLLLARDDVKKHVGDHDRADHCADMNERGTRAEDVEQRPCRSHHKHEYEPHEQVLVLLQYPAQRVVDDPASGEKRDADGDGGDGRKC